MDILDSFSPFFAATAKKCDEKGRYQEKAAAVSFNEGLTTTRRKILSQ